jgi:hypothetical protein
MADSDAPTSQLGPSDPDVADDDLANLPSGPRRRSPIMALAVIALAGVLTWHLRADFIYALSSRTPIDLGDARSIAALGAASGAGSGAASGAADALRDNRYATVSGQAERRYALAIDPRGGSTDKEQLFRLLGAGTRLFVRAQDDKDRTDLVEKWTGRLRRFDALPYHAELRKYYRDETQVTRYLSLPSLKAQLAAGNQPPPALTDRTGAPVNLASDDQIIVDVAFPHELKIYLPQEKFPSLQDAQHELDRLGLSPSAGETTKDEFVFNLPLPDERKNEILAKLAQHPWPFQPRQERYVTKRSALTLVGDTLKIEPKTIVPFANVREIGVPAPIDVGHDAFILVEGEAPSQFLWVPFLVVMLLAFAAFNVWYLVRTRPSSRAQT